MEPTLRLDRTHILPEPELPQAAELLAEGCGLARTVTVGPCPFLVTYGVRTESEYKRLRMAEGTIMLHAQIGYRSLAKSQRAYAEIYERVAAAGHRVDRYGICLDWSMGYPASQRAHMPRGTGLLLDKPQDFAALTRCAPVAPHFGDFVIGTPAAVENTAAALAAGATSIGNLGQYFTFRLPRWHDDVWTTAETVKALALCAAQPVEVLIHSNLDDGFAALFCDMACSVGAVLRRLGIQVVDAGVSADPDAVAERARAAGADLIAVSTYNGVALDYLQALRQEMARTGLDLPIFIGGKLNQVPDDSPSSMPVDVTGELEALGAVVCQRVEDMLKRLLEMAQERPS